MSGLRRAVEAACNEHDQGRGLCVCEMCRILQAHPGGTRRRYKAALREIRREVKAARKDANGPMPHSSVQPEDMLIGGLNDVAKIAKRALQ